MTGVTTHLAKDFDVLFAERLKAEKAKLRLPTRDSTRPIIVTLIIWDFGKPATRLA